MIKTILTNLFIYPVIGVMCITLFAYGKIYKSKLHIVLSLLGVVALFMVRDFM